MLYLDTSLVVTMLVVEPATKRVREWLAAKAPQQFVISDWVRTEFSSALSVKVRMGALLVDESRTARRIFEQYANESLFILPFETRFFCVAANYADASLLGLRSGDALHLAVASAHRATICTRDRRFGEAAQALGYQSIIL